MTTRTLQQRPFWLLFIVCALGIAWPRPAAAQDGVLTPFVPVEGSIGAPGETQQWRFTALEGAMISLLVQPDSSPLDPAISLANSSGTVLVTNDDFDYPDRFDALLQGVTLPRTDTYVVTVSSYAQTSGAYLLTLFSGYAEQVFTDNFEETSSRWEPSRESLSVNETESTLTLSLDGVSVSGFVYDEDSAVYSDFYAQALFTIVTGRNGWEAGLVVRRTESGHYAVVVNQRGQWRMIFTDADNTERVIRDWTNHPAIRAGETLFTLGVLAHGAGFDVFYNDAYVGQAVDEDFAALEGLFGFYAGTASAVGSATTITVDTFIITEPVQLGEPDTDPDTDTDTVRDITPNQIMPGSLGLTIQELERRRVIPAGGTQALNVPSSSGVEVNAGVNRILLGRGMTFGSMVISTTFTRVSVPDGLAGCGILFANTGDTNHGVAFLDSTGAYGLSIREGAAYLPGLFGESGTEAWTQGRQHLLVIVLEDRIHYYVNRQYVGTLETAVISGEIGNVVVNYDPVNTTCDFSDTWVWTLP